MLVSARRECFGGNRRAAAALRPETDLPAVFRNVSLVLFLRATGLSTCARDQPVKTALKASGQTRYNRNTGRRKPGPEKRLDCVWSNIFFQKKDNQCRPLSFWTERDIWDYIELYKIPISDLYGQGYQRNGCMFCGFGLCAERRKFGINRFERLSLTHPEGNMTTWCPDGHLYSRRAEFPIDAILIISFYAYITGDF